MSTLSLRIGVAPALFACVVAALTVAGPANAARRDVVFSPEYPAGEIIISQRQRALYFTEGDGRAIRYPVAIGKRGMAWLGSAEVEGKYMAPDWSPPAIVAHDHPELPNFIPGGSPHNPMGAAAITLSRYQVAIHGTTQHMRRSIGSAASYGCIRMYNEDVVDLYQRINVGTPVLAVP
ncbi:MAG: L,D-transpeptidase [Methylovirgula sp.]|uniref:L,D-transpeptidase n=1 Tax=Methylovirgula sp. TaxID=1978224 RepID=UPI0030764E5D